MEHTLFWAFKLKGKQQLSVNRCSDKGHVACPLLSSKAFMALGSFLN